MFDRVNLSKIQEIEETAFKDLPEELQKLATVKDRETDEVVENDLENTDVDAAQEGKPECPVELPPLISEEMQAEKDRLLHEGFSDWSRHDYTIFVKASAKHSRDAIDKIAFEVGKAESIVREYATAFWGEFGRTRITAHEYDRVVKMIERGEKKIFETKSLERATRILVSHFDNPWEELEFAHVNCKDKMFTAEEDRHLLCWSRKVNELFQNFFYVLFSLPNLYFFNSMDMANGWP